MPVSTLLDSEYSSTTLTWFLVDHSVLKKLQALPQARNHHHQRQEEEEVEKAAAAARTLVSEAWHTS